MNRSIFFVRMRKSNGFPYFLIFSSSHHKISMKSAWNLVYVKSIELFTCFSEFFVSFCNGSMYHWTLTTLMHQKQRKQFFMTLTLWCLVLCVMFRKTHNINVTAYTTHIYWIIRDNVSMSLLFEKKRKKC